MLTPEQAVARFPGAVTFRYGDSAVLNAKILALVREGCKSVACDAWATFAVRGEPLPVPGRVDIALDWQGIPAQGEFLDLAAWRARYEACLHHSGLFNPRVEMLIETFEVAEDFA